MYSLTVFKNQYDNKTDKRIDFQTWPEFVELLRKLSTTPSEGKSMQNLYHQLFIHLVQLERTKMSCLGDVGVLLMLTIMSSKGT